MIEIAISLAIIGFALVAIIGILPVGMGVQKTNRQETIIGADSSIWMNAIRNGERGVDDLTNYVMAITNYWARYNAAGQYQASGADWYTRGASSMTPQLLLTNGFRIVGLLSTPKLVPLPPQNPRLPPPFRSNHVVAFVRSMSGPASEKFPQTDPVAKELGLSYRLISEVVPYGTNFYNPAWTNFNDPQIAGNTNEIARRFYQASIVTNFQANLHELRLTFRWPLMPNGNVGVERQAFRTTVGGFLQPTNEPAFPSLPEYMLYFFKPRTYVKAP